MAASEEQNLKRRIHGASQAAETQPGPGAEEIARAATKPRSVRDHLGRYKQRQAPPPRKAA